MAEDPAHITAELTAIVDVVLIVMVDTAELLHPFISVPVTLYVLLAVGEITVTVVPVVPLKPVAGDHKYELAPLAVKRADPIHTEAEFTFTIGRAFTVTNAVPELLPQLLIPVTVYTVVTAGLAITDTPAVLFKPVAGDHK